MNSSRLHGLQRLLCSLLIFVLSTGPVFAELDAGSSDPQASTKAPDQVIAENVAQLEQSLQDPTKRSVLDWARVLQQKVIEYKKPSRIQPGNLTLEVLNGVDRVTARIYQGAQAIGNGASLNGSQFALAYQGERILELSIPIHSAVFHQGRLYFLESGRPDPQTGLLELSFIDLNYFASALGRTQLPIFRIPLKLNGEAFNLGREGDRLRVGREAIPNEYLDHMAGLQQVAWNLNVSFVNPKELEAATETLNDFGFYFDRSLELAGNDVTEQMARVGQFEKFKADSLQNLKTSLEQTKSAEGINPELKKVFSSIAENHQNQRKLFARMGRLWGKLSLPQPMGAPSVVEGFRLISQGLVGPLGVRDSQPSISSVVKIKEGVLRILNSRAGKLTTAAAATALFLYQGNDIAASGLDYAISSAVNLGELVSKTTMNTLAGVNPVRVYEAYLTPERLPRLMVGATAAATVLFMSLGLPHIIVNAHLLAKDLARSHREGKEKALAESTPFTFLDSIRFVKNAFIARQKAEEEKFINNLSRSSKKGGESSAESDWLVLSAEDQRTLAEMSESDREAFKDQKREEQTQRVRSIIAEDRSRSSSPWAARFASFASKLNVFKFLMGSPDSVYGAMVHFIFSSASLTNSGHVYVKMWNMWFAFRSFVLSPVLAATFIYYPNYFPVLMKRDKGVDIPSYYNGGLRPFYEHEWLRLKSLFGGEHLKQLNAFEDAILPIERAVHEAVLKKAYTALLKRVDDPQSLRTIFETNGIDNLADPTIKDLSGEMRAYFRSYYEKLFQESMNTLLHEFLVSQNLTSYDNDAEVLKVAALGRESDLKAFASSVDPKSFVEKALKSNPRFDDEVKTSLFAQFHLRNIALLDPSKNRQIARLQSVKRQAGNAQAMARAVRATKAAILVDKPLELIMMFVLLAGVTEGINVPLHNEMFSDDAWFFLGRYPFLTGYVSGVITSVLADIWMKLQQDEQNEGKFENVPEGDEAKLSFKSYLFKKMFKNPDNTLWKNQLHYNKIIWANMRAAFVMMAVTNFLTLGRFDLDVYFLGYFFAYAIPTGGLAFKIEQGFELASAWYAKIFPAELRSHPEAQKYLNERIGRARIGFNFFYKMYENTLGVFMSNLMTIATQGLGPRALTRFMFLGYTPTELVGNSMDWVGDKLSGIPGAQSCAKGIRHLVTNHYNSGIKLTSKP